MSRIVIRGGLVITATEEIEADVLVEDETIAAIAAVLGLSLDAVWAEISATGTDVATTGGRWAS